MNLFVFVVVIVAIEALFVLGVIIFSLLLLRRIWRRTRPDQLALRSLLVAVGLVFITSPYVATKIYERHFDLARVPNPLEVAEVEYRLEKLWGVGFMPGDNETGFVVYQLTDESADWAREQGIRLGDMLAGTKGTWRQTPVDDSSDQKATDLWHPYDDRLAETGTPLEEHPPSIFEYLEKYGFTIPIDKEHEAEIDRVIASKGSFYSYGQGGSVTIVDPAKGKVYFAYAG